MTDLVNNISRTNKRWREWDNIFEENGENFQDVATVVIRNDNKRQDPSKRPRDGLMLLQWMKQILQDVKKYLSPNKNEELLLQLQNVDIFPGQPSALFTEPGLSLFCVLWKPIWDLLLVVHPSSVDKQSDLSVYVAVLDFPEHLWACIHTVETSTFISSISSDTCHHPSEDCMCQQLQSLLRIHREVVVEASLSLFESVALMMHLILTTPSVLTANLASYFTLQEVAAFFGGILLCRAGLPFSMDQAILCFSRPFMVERCKTNLDQFALVLVDEVVDKWLTSNLFILRSYEMEIAKQPASTATLSPVPVSPPDNKVQHSFSESAPTLTDLSNPDTFMQAIAAQQSLVSKLYAAMNANLKYQEELLQLIDSNCKLLLMQSSTVTSTAENQLAIPATTVETPTHIDHSTISPLNFSFEQACMLIKNQPPPFTDMFQFYLPPPSPTDQFLPPFPSLSSATTTTMESISSSPSSDIFDFFQSDNHDNLIDSMDPIITNHRTALDLE